jgi:hypothetical protein
MKSGFVWDASFNYFLNNHYGIGLNFYRFRAAHKEFAQNSDTGISGDLKEIHQITYFGPAFAGRLPFGREKAWIFDYNIGFGYIGYRSRTFFPDYKRTLTGVSLGSRVVFGLSYKISSYWSFGFNVHSTAGVLTKMQQDENGVQSTLEFEKNTGEGLGQIGLSLGIRYSIK